MMPTFRRTQYDARIEILPLIDVIFLGLTFFIYAMVLMVRVDLLPVPMPTYVSGEAATPAPAISVTIDLHGQLWINQIPATIDDLAPSLSDRASLMEDPAIYLIMAEGNATVDRGPILTSIWDTLQTTGLEINLVGLPPKPQPDRP